MGADPGHRPAGCSLNLLFLACHGGRTVLRARSFYYLLLGPVTAFLLLRPAHIPWPRAVVDVDSDACLDDGCGGNKPDRT